MDFSFHLQQGQLLLEKQNANSVRKALEHFRQANELTGLEDIAKPRTLFYLALGNLNIGQIQQSYRLVCKAKRSLDLAVRNSLFSMDNMRQKLGEDDIDELITHIEDNYSELISFTDKLSYQFDENILDFSLLHQIYPNEEESQTIPRFTLDDLGDELIFATFYGLSRSNDELIYFDKLNGDVLNHVQGYFSSLIGDTGANNRRLSSRILNNEPLDFVDEERYLLIDRLLLSDFLDEYKTQSKGREPFSSFPDLFSNELLRQYSYDDVMTTADLAFSNYIQKRFLDTFRENYNEAFETYNHIYQEIFENTLRTIATNWIRKNVFGQKKVLVESELEELSISELFELRRKCSENKDLESLLTIAKWRFVKGSAATNESNLPEMCYYFGRLQRAEELKLFLEEKSFYLFMLPESCKDMAQKLLTIGLRFPALTESEVSYLEEKYCDSKTFELFDIIMFDQELLPRQIARFDKDLLNRSNTDFSKELIFRVFDCFLVNDELDSSYAELYVYSRINNNIIRKMYDGIGLGEFWIVEPIRSNQYWSLLEKRFGEDCADEIIREHSSSDDWEDFKNLDFYLLDAYGIEQVANEYFKDPQRTNEIKALVAEHWLFEINSLDISLS